MKLTITFSGKQGRYRKSISVRTLVGVTVLSSLFVLVSSRSTESAWENTARVRLAQTDLAQESESVSRLKSETDAKLSVITEQMAEMQAMLGQLDGQSRALAKELGMKEDALDDFALAVTTTEDNTLDQERDALLGPINKLQAELQVKTMQLQTLERLVMGHHIDEQISLSGRPIETGWLSSYYGMRADPFTGEPAMHKGLDFAGESGEGVVATAAGIVTWAGERYGYGYLVEIEHGDGLVTRYGHNQSVAVAVGDVVTKGQVIALMGNTGRSTGAHVHYEVIKHGQQIDPLPYVYKK